MPEARGRLNRGLPIAVVELAAAPASDVHEQPVEDLGVLLVHVESQVQERAQESAALGDALADDVIDETRRGRRGIRP